MQRPILIISFILFSCIHCSQNKNYSRTSFERVTRYLKQHKKLPPNYVTKRYAYKKGWKPRKGNLWQVLPGKSIGGDRFGNREKRLPYCKRWQEADIDYRGGRRGAKRIVFCRQSNDKMLIYKTLNHYSSFTRIP